MCSKKVLSLVMCIVSIFTVNLFCAKDPAPDIDFNKLFGEAMKLGKSSGGSKSLSKEKLEKKLSVYAEYSDRLSKLQAQKNAAQQMLREAQLHAGIMDEAAAARADADRAADAIRRIDAEIAKVSATFGECERDLEQYRQLLSRKSSTGVTLARIFAGTAHRNQLNEDEIDSWYAGVWEGVSVPMSDVLNDRLKKTLDTHVGGLWDLVFGRLGDFFSMIGNAIFHDSCEPFDSRKLDGWQKIIMAAYDDIDLMIRNGLRDTTRSLDPVSRQFDDAGAEVQAKKEIDMWATLAGGYAEQFAYFVNLFESREEYYDEDDIVVFYSRQICQMLQATRKLLASSKSLKDLDSKLESQKSIIPAIKKNISNLFEQLKAEVTPKSYSMNGKSTTSSSPKTPAYQATNPYGYGNDAITPFAGGF